MAKYLNETSRTFSEFLLIPGLTTKDCVPGKVSLKTPLTKYQKGQTPDIELNIPFVSAIMQSVSNDGMAIALAKNGGLSFVFGSQSIQEQAEMIRKVKNHKSGFVISTANLTEEHTLRDVIALKAKTGHSTIAITDNGTAEGKLLGIVTSRDYRVGTDASSKKVKEFMTPFDKLITAKLGCTLKEANDLIWEHKLNSLPVIDEDKNFKFFVFRKDYENHKDNPLELTDKQKKLVVGAGINTRDYAERVPALIEAGADVLCIDSSDGFSEWQRDTLQSICITRETKGIGRGQATALIEVAAARDEYYEQTGIYVPICSDGGIAQDYHMVLALAMGADFLMMGRYFARFDESPTRKLMVNGNYVKEYWGEGSNRARNWERYDMGDTDGLKFEEGVDSYVPYAGSLKDNLAVTLGKIKSTMCSCGTISIGELKEKASITLVSSVSIVEGGAHDVIVKE
jgi:IMP dehydrogenase